MPAYVTLPGTSGNYFSTADVNLLDADTAHLHQSAGAWTNWSACVPSIGDDLTPVFGDNHGKGAISTSATTFGVQTPSGSSGIPVSASTQYSASAYLAASDATDGDMYLTVLWYNGAGAFLSSANSTFLTPSTTFQLATITATSPVGAAFANLRIRIAGATAAGGGEFLYWDKVCFRTGSDATFVPSLRIVGDLDIEAKVALDDYTPTATNTILDCLNSNDGYRLRHTTVDLIEIAYGNGSSTRAQSSSATGLTDGEAYVFKVTVDESTGAVVYYIDGVQHDTDTMTTGAGSPNINDLVVGANAAASANWTDGDIYYVIVRDGIDGPVVARFDADDWVGV